MASCNMSLLRTLAEARAAVLNRLAKACRQNPGQMQNQLLESRIQNSPMDARIFENIHVYGDTAENNHGNVVSKKSIAHSIEITSHIILTGRTHGTVLFS